MATKCFKITATLVDDMDSSKDIFSKFGRSKSGLIKREFVVREDMPLYALHYALEKAFGFLNEHLHMFELNKDDFDNLTKGSSKIWRENVGILFKSPFRDENEDFWCDDYKSGSFENWRKKKYKPPFIYKGLYPTKDDQQNNNNYFIKKFNDQFVVRTNEKYNYKTAVTLFFHKKKDSDITNEYICSFNELPIETLHTLFDHKMTALLETLTIKEMFEHYKSFTYSYDYGDNWEFKIEIDEYVDEEDEEYVNLTKLPKMISFDGLNLVEDVGGISGYCRFLYTLYNLKEIKEFEIGSYESDNKYYVPIQEINGFDYYIDLQPNQLRRWAKSLEWKEYFLDLDKWF